MGKGRRVLVMISNLLCIGFSLMCCVENFWVIAVGRIGVGIASGLIVAAAPKIIDETVPSQYIDYGFGASTNMFINSGIMIMTLMAVANPPSDDYDALNNSSYWKIIYGSCAIPCAASFLLFLLVHREDSLFFLLEKN
jgi:MFS family permease